MAHKFVIKKTSNGEYRAYFNFNNFLLFVFISRLV